MNDHQSMWVAKASALHYPVLDSDLAVDVAVVGGGIVGLTTALLLKQEGLRVAVIEADRIGAGTTGHSTAKVTVLHSLTYSELRKKYDAETARNYAQANQAGLQKVVDLVNQYAIDCDLKRAPAYTYTADPGQVDQIRQEVEAAREAGLNADFVSEIDLPYPIAGAVRINDQAMFDAYRYILGLAKQVNGENGEIYEQSRIVSCDEENGSCVLKTREGNQIRAMNVILATQLPFIDRGFYFARTYPSRSYLIAARLNNPAQMPHGMYIGIDGPGHTLRPAYDGQYLITGGQAHKAGQETHTEACYAAIREWTHTHFDVASIDYEWSAMDFMPVDCLPMVGQLATGTDHIFTVTGLRKWGLSNGTAAAIMLTDLIQKRLNPWHHTFDSLRLNLVQGVSEFVSENLNVAKRYVGDKLSTINSPDAETLQPGQAGMVQYNGELVAGYRSPDGILYAVAPACTHLGCNITWNEAETTWDCPCHGSRFKPDGSVIHGPAVVDLERKA